MLSTGIGQDCPSSAVAFALGLRRALESAKLRLAAELPGRDGAIRFLSYIDDLILHVDLDIGETALRIVEEELKRVGLELNHAKCPCIGPEPGGAALIARAAAGTAAAKPAAAEEVAAAAAAAPAEAVAAAADDQPLLHRIRSKTVQKRGMIIVGTPSGSGSPDLSDYDDSSAIPVGDPVFIRHFLDGAALHVRELIQGDSAFAAARLSE